MTDWIKLDATKSNKQRGQVFGGVQVNVLSPYDVPTAAKAERKSETGGLVLLMGECGSDVDISALGKDPSNRASASSRSPTRVWRLIRTRR